MAAWLVAALALIGGQIARRAPAGAARAVAAGAAGAAAGTALADPSGGFLPDIFGGGDGRPRRRRRRRALTASDKADIGFITGLLGPGAGKQFAVTIATRAS